MEHSHEASFLGYLPLCVSVVIWMVYLFGVVSQKAKGRRWEAGRTIAFTIGMSLVAASVLPSFHTIAHHDIRVHMMLHLALGMFAPIGLVLGAPITLALKSLPKKLSRRMAFVLHSQPVRLLSHPITALILNLGGMFVLYLTPLYLSLNSYPILHFLVHVHFLLAGYLFAWSISGVDPVPKRPSFFTRLCVVFLAIALHAGLSKYLYSQQLPSGTHHSAEQIQEAAKIMYYGGDVSELILLFYLFFAWYHRSQLKMDRNQYEPNLNKKERYAGWTWILSSEDEPKLRR